MLPAHVDMLPFPSTLIFEDVEARVLFAESDAETLPDEPTSWLLYMQRVLPQQVGA